MITFLLVTGMVVWCTPVIQLFGGWCGEYFKGGDYGIGFLTLTRHRLRDNLQLECLGGARGRQVD